MSVRAEPITRRRIYLMRHAEVSYFDAQGQPLDPRQVPLTERGRQQAASAGSLLADIRFDLAVCSGLPRTEETARHIINARALPLHTDPRLQEIRGARLREIPREDRERTIAYAYDGAEHAGARFIGGELWSDFAVRVNQAWAQLIVRDDWQNLLVVAHDAVNRVLLGQIIGCGLGGLKGFEQDPACINIIEADIHTATIQRAFIRTLNLTAYDLIRPNQQLTVMEKVWRDYRSS